MDMFCLLPVEVAQNIFKLLEIKDLFNCMAVSKVWRNLINCNYVWQHFYDIYDIEIMTENREPSYKTGSDSLMPLCGYAIELKKFLMSPAGNWRCRRFSNFYINLKFKQWKVVCCEPFIAIMYLSKNELHVFNCSGKELECVDIISVNLPHNSLEQSILISKKYIVLGAYNITLVYRMIDGHFKLYKTFALTYNPGIYSTDNDFDSFIMKYLLTNNAVFERVLWDDVLWITDVNGVKHIINLNDGKIVMVSSLFLHTKMVQPSPYVINYVDVNMSISTITGVILSTFTVSRVDKIFYMNDNVLVICFPRVIENQNFEIECREILSGNLIRKLSVHERTRVTLHPQKNYLYLLSTQPALYNVTSYCILTGDKLWSYEVSCGPHMFWGSFLYVIDSRFLFVYPAPSCDDFYALFNLQGKLLYESLFTPGILLYFSEGSMLAKEEGRLHLLNFKNLMF